MSNTQIDRTEQVNVTAEHDKHSRAWNNHIDELSKLYYDLPETEMKWLRRIQKQLKDIVKIAGNNAYL